MTFSICIATIVVKGKATLTATATSRSVSLTPLTLRLPACILSRVQAPASSRHPILDVVFYLDWGSCATQWHCLFIAYCLLFNQFIHPSTSRPRLIHVLAADDKLCPAGIERLDPHTCQSLTILFFSLTFASPPVFEPAACLLAASITIACFHCYDLFTRAHSTSESHRKVLLCS